MKPPDPTTAQALAATRAWLERAVIGLNLCPFAKAVHSKGLVRWVCSEARDTTVLLHDLEAEMTLLRDTPATQIDTTLLVHPGVLSDFIDFNQFLDDADALLHELGLVGVLQVASFHPHYQFAGTEPDDIGNATNRSPFPTLHLLREASVERAVQAFPEPEAIVEANQRSLRELGPQGWAAVQAQCLRDAGS
ncbi:MAG: DUF1415 domain-containing protein [Rubrivivax sp.]